MSIDKWKAELDTAQKQFVEVKEIIEELQNKIANALCPLKIGEKITVVANGKEIQGVIEYISSFSSPINLPDSTLGSEAGWTAGGHRLNKTTGDVGKWSFAINSFDSKLADGKWVHESPNAALYGQMCWLSRADDDIGY